MEIFVGREIKKTHNLIHRLLDARLKINPDKGITFADRQICMYLFNNAPRAIYQKDIEKDFSLRRSSASAQLSKMEGKGLIVRHSDSEDKRLKRIELTEKARDKLTASLKEVHKMEELIVGGLTEEEKENFLKTIEKIQQNILELIKS